MMLGTDIENIDRFPEFDSNKDFYNKIFSEKEINYCLKKDNPRQSFAGKFSAKEAVIKCLGTNEIELKNIEILNEVSGKPYVSIDKKKSNIQISISHTKDLAFAVAMSYPEKLSR